MVVLFPDHIPQKRKCIVWEIWRVFFFPPLVGCVSFSQPSSELFSHYFLPSFSARCCCLDHIPETVMGQSDRSSDHTQSYGEFKLSYTLTIHFFSYSFQFKSKVLSRYHRSTPTILLNFHPFFFTTCTDTWITNNKMQIHYRWIKHW